jgi:hypothetical protein
MDWHDLHKMKVTDLREMAKQKLAIEGASGLHKEELVAKLAEAMGIPRPHKVVDAEGKTAIKQRIRTLRPSATPRSPRTTRTRCTRRAAGSMPRSASCTGWRT